MGFKGRGMNAFGVILAQIFLAMEFEKNVGYLAEFLS